MKMATTKSSSYTSVFEIVGDSVSSDSLTLQKVIALQSILTNIIVQMQTEDSVPIIVPTEQSVILIIFDTGKLLFDIILASKSELNRYNSSRNSIEKIIVKIGIDYAGMNRLITNVSETVSEIMLVASVSKAQRLVAFGSSGDILMSEDFYRAVMVRGPLAKYVSYYGRYQDKEAHEVGVWGFYDSAHQIGNSTPPSNMRVEDEKGIAVYTPPYFKLCKPRLVSFEKAQELATREVKILALSPHPNDIPWGCAGTLMWFKEVFDARIYLHFLTSTRSPHRTGDPRYGPPSRALGPALWSYGILTCKDPILLMAEIGEQSEEEAIRKIVVKIPRLGRTPHQIYIEGQILDQTLDKPPLPPEGMFSDGYLDKYPNVLRDRLSWLQANIGPDIILCPSLKDIHQDHKATAEAAMTVFKFQESIWFYELPQASRNPYYYFTPNLFIDVNPYAERKLSLLTACFEYDTKRFHFSPDGAQALMRTRAIEGYYERSRLPESTVSTPPHVEAFETRLYLK